MAELLKDQFFTQKSIDVYISHIKSRYPELDKAKFKALIFDDNWESLELKARMRHVTLCLNQVLPDDYNKAVDILIDVAEHITGFEAMTLPDYVELYGLDDWDTSLPALRHFTQFSSSEFAIRPFIAQDKERAMEFMLNLADDENDRVRRFASEGCRPRLPWAMALPELKKDPSLIWPVLEKLKDDESEFVRKSVSNNLNDISKDNPDEMLEVCTNWFGVSENTDKIIKHACRTLFKAGDQRAMKLFGYGDVEHIRIQNLLSTPEMVKIGEDGHVSFDMVVDQDKACKIRIEYSIDYVKANGKTSKKVFKITENTYQPGTHPYKRKISFQEMTTRKHYPGKHRVAVIINGIEKASTEIDLVE